MNDRYLYKAKRKDNGEWVEGNILQSDDRYYIVSEFGISCIEKNKNQTGNNMITLYAFEVDSSTICQCTGKCDNTRTKEFPEGKLIFEHDIVAFLDIYSTESGYAEQDCIGEVLWDDEELCFYVTDRLSAESYEVLDDCKIIGNRFDNLELLEVEE